MRKLSLLALLFSLLAFASCERTSPVIPRQIATSTSASDHPTSTSQSDSLGKIAYIQGGDIWVNELPDGTPMRLTNDGANGAPHWSPSGEWLTFTRGAGGPWVMRVDGGSSHAVNEGGSVYSSLSWSPVADRLAYVTESGALAIEDADGSNRRELVPPSDRRTGNAFQIAWSPDGEWLAFDREEWTYEKVGTGKGQIPGRTASLWRVQAGGDEAIQLYNMGSPSRDGIILVDWTPDSRSILFWPRLSFSVSVVADGLPLHIISASGGEPRKLDAWTLRFSDFLDASSDGRLLAITEGSGRETWTRKRIAVLDIASGTRTYLTDSSEAAFSPAWSPDGGRIVYVAGPDIGAVGGGNEAKVGAGQRRLWVMQRDGSDKRQLTNDPAYRDERPQWSNDGTRILFARLNAEGDRASLWLVSGEGGTPEPVVDELSPSSPPASWFGYYGHINWAGFFDWWRAPA